MAILAPLLAIMVTGVIQIGVAVFQQMQAQAAAEAGALYAAKYAGTNFSAINVASAVTGATGTSGITATPAPVQFCGCPTAAGITSQACGGTCASSGLAVGTYVGVSAKITAIQIFPAPYINLPLPTTFTGYSVVRTQ